VINGVKGCRKVKKTKTGDFLRTSGINELVMNIKMSSFSGMMFTVGRLVRVYWNIGIGKSRFYNKQQTEGK